MGARGAYRRMLPLSLDGLHLEMLDLNGMHLVVGYKILLVVQDTPVAVTRVTRRFSSWDHPRTCRPNVLIFLFALSDIFKRSRSPTRDSTSIPDAVHTIVRHEKRLANK